MTNDASGAKKNENNFVRLGTLQASREKLANLKRKNAKRFELFLRVGTAENKETLKIGLKTQTVKY